MSHGLIKPDPERLRPLVNLPSPENTKELRRALGMFAYYAKWIPKFSEKIRPLAATSTFPLTAEGQQAFVRLKEDLLGACLGSVDEDSPFTVECDASDFAIAAILSQRGQPVAFMSRTLSKSESKYPSVEKEASSIIEAVRKLSLIHI